MSTCPNALFYGKPSFIFPSTTTGHRLIPIVPVLSSLSLLLASVHQSEEVITNISVIQDWRWFFRLTPLETVFLGIILLQLCVLQYLGILPMNINNYLGGDPSGRRKRRKKRETLQRHSHYNNSQQDNSMELMELLLTTLRRIDQNSCVMRTLCELEAHSMQSRSGRNELPKGIQLILDTFSTEFSGNSNSTGANSTSGSSLWSSSSPSNGFPVAIQLYVDAMKLGQLNSHCYPQQVFHLKERTNSSSLCNEHFRDCRLSIDNILSYIDTIHFDDIF